MLIPIPFGVPANLKELEARTAESRREVAELREVVRQLGRRVEQQAAVLRVLYRILMETHGMTEAEFLDRVRQAENERAGAPPKTCLHCGKVLSPRHNRCIYCGEVRPVESAAELL